MIFNIQKCSVHDGEGLRTLVFFKGCPLHCLWCANPESQSPNQEIMEFPRNCIGCGACLKVCSHGAITLTDGYPMINRDLCNNCCDCVNVCYAESKKITGKEMVTEELFQEINKDRLFYQNFGGGVTFSGGEPLMQTAYLVEIAKMCKKNHIRTAIETCGYGKYQDFKKALPYIDRVFIDIKHIDSAIHKKLTGVGNERILENVRAISTHGIPITVRTPVVPGYNDSAENISGIASFIKDLPNIQEYELLPYHNLGASKYASLAIPYALENVVTPSDEEIAKLVRLANCILQPYGKQCFYTRKNKKEICI